MSVSWKEKEVPRVVIGEICPTMLVQVLALPPLLRFPIQNGATELARSLGSVQEDRALDPTLALLMMIPLCFL